MSVENIIPIGEYLLVGVDNNSVEEGTLILQANTPKNRGIIKAVGDKVNTDNGSTKLEVGNKVIFIPGNGVAINNSEDSDFLISIKNIIGKIGE